MRILGFSRPPLGPIFNARLCLAMDHMYLCPGTGKGPAVPLHKTQPFVLTFHGIVTVAVQLRFYLQYSHGMLTHQDFAISFDSYHCFWLGSNCRNHCVPIPTPEGTKQKLLSAMLKKKSSTCFTCDFAVWRCPLFATVVHSNLR